VSQADETVAGEATATGWAAQDYFDTSGYPTSEAGPDGMATGYAWDETDDRPLTEVDHHAPASAGEETSYAYDAEGRLVGTYGPTPPGCLSLVTPSLPAGTGATTTTTAPTTSTGPSTSTTAPSTTTTGTGTTTTTTTGTGASRTITAVGPVYQSEKAMSLPVSPQAVGDLMVMAVSLSGATVASVSGGGVSTWQKETAVTGSQLGNDDEIWWGAVGSTGASTISVTLSGTAGWHELEAQEYSAGAGAVWSVDTQGSASSATSTVTFPSLSPAGTGELYFGYAGGNGTASVGSTPGFTYAVTGSDNLLAWDPAVSSTASPTATQSATGSDSVAALFSASSVPAAAATTTTAPSTTTTVTTTTAGQAQGATTYMVSLTGGVVLEARGSTRAWYYPDLQGSTAAEASSAGTAVGGVTLCDPFGNTLTSLQADSPDGLAYGLEGSTA
jgi:hypothetical protein